MLSGAFDIAIILFKRVLYRQVYIAKLYHVHNIKQHRINASDKWTHRGILLKINSTM